MFFSCFHGSIALNIEKTAETGVGAVMEAAPALFCLLAVKMARYVRVSLPSKEVDKTAPDVI